MGNGCGKSDKKDETTKETAVAQLDRELSGGHIVAPLHSSDRIQRLEPCLPLPSLPPADGLGAAPTLHNELDFKKLSENKRRVRSEIARLHREEERHRASSHRYDQLSRAATLLGGRRDPKLAKTSQDFSLESRDAAAAASQAELQLQQLENNSLELERITGGRRIGLSSGKLSYRASCDQLFTAQEKIGAGAFGSVYVGHRVDAWVGDSEPVYAVKKMQKGDADDQMEVRQEELALAMCDHPNIVKLICSLHSADEHALVMECVRGRTLSEAVAAPGYGFTQQVTQQVATAIGHIHSLGIIHRDINPKNLIISFPLHEAAAGEHAEPPEPLVTLVDFGQAIVLPEANIVLAVENTIGGGFLGYRAPEMMKGEPHSYPVDFFSLGGLMHLMLTGQPLYKTKDAEESGTRTQGLARAQSIDEAASQLMETLLCPDPDARGGLDSVRSNEWLFGDDSDWDMVDTSFTNEASRSSSRGVATCTVLEHEMKVFGEWFWGGLLKDHWELVTGGQKLLSDDSVEPDLDPKEGWIWDSSWVAGAWQKSSMGGSRKREWMRRQVKS